MTKPIRKRKPYKRMFVFLSVAILAGILALGGLYAAVYAQERLPDQPRHADCIIVLGNKVNRSGPSLSLAGRLERALELYSQGYALSIIVCGGMGANEPATEASVMRGWLIEKGVPPSAIHMDEVSRNTRENIREAKRIMDEQGFADAIVCTSDFHAYRAVRTARGAGIDCSEAKAYTIWGTKHISRLRECFSWIKFFLGM